jgi:mannitol/fructose-specific phosphotransferase system IIA component (Ntr-type)
MIATIEKLLTPDHITLDLQAVDAAAAIREVADALAHHPGVADFSAFCEAILAREALSPTATPHGAAFPHARTNCVREIIMAAGRSEAGVEFPGCARRVHWIFIIGTPPQMVREYLGLLGALAKLTREPGVRENLARAATPAEFVAALQEKPPA